MSAAGAVVDDEVMDLPLGDVGLELLQGRRVVTATETADRHDRRAGGQLQAAGRVRSDSRCGPTVVGLGKQGFEFGVLRRLNTLATRTGATPKDTMVRRLALIYSPLERQWEIAAALDARVRTDRKKSAEAADESSGTDLPRDAQLG